MSQDLRNLLTSFLASAMWAGLVAVVAWLAKLDLARATISVPVYVILLLSALLVAVVIWWYLSRSTRTYRCHDQLQHEFGDPVVDPASRARTVWHGVGGTQGVLALVFGPYDPLRKGTYLAYFRMKVSITQPGAYVYYDVAHSRGGGPAEIRQEGKTQSDSGQHYGDGVLRFVVTEDLLKDVWEWRVRVPVPGAEVWCDTVTVARKSRDTTLWGDVATTPDLELDPARVSRLQQPREADS